MVGGAPGGVAKGAGAADRGLGEQAESGTVVMELTGWGTLGGAKGGQAVGGIGGRVAGVGVKDGGAYQGS